MWVGGTCQRACVGFVLLDGDPGLGLVGLVHASDRRNLLGSSHVNFGNGTALF